MFDDVGNGAVLDEHERRRSLEQLSIGKLTEVLLTRGLPCCFSPLTLTRGQRFSMRRGVSLPRWRVVPARSLLPGFRADATTKKPPSRGLLRGALSAFSELLRAMRRYPSMQFAK